MTKSETVTVVFTGETEFTDWLSADPNPDMPTAPSDVFYRVERGEREDNGKAGYIVHMRVGADGQAIASDIMGSVPSAFNKAAEMLGMAKGAVAGETSLKTLFPRPAKSDNNPPEELLSEEDLNKADAFIAEVESGLSELAEGETSVREAHRHIGVAVRDMRSAFSSKAAWGQVKAERIKSAPDNVRKVLDNANAVSLYCKFANLSESDVFAALPEDVRTPRTVEKEIGKLYTAIAVDFVDVVYGEDAKARKPFDIKKGQLTTAGLVSYLEQYDTQTRADIEAGFEAAGAALASAHLGNLSSLEGDVFTVENNEGAAKTKASRVSSTLFGTEGPDEMVNAVAKAANGWAAAQAVAVAKADAATDGVKALSAAISRGNAFSAMDVETAALHLLRIVAGRLDDDNRAASSDDADAILDFMGTRLDAFRAGEMDVADVIATPGEGPESADDADDAADAA
jgi:hypothetical protein